MFKECKHRVKIMVINKYILTSKNYSNKLAMCVPI